MYAILLKENKLLRDEVNKLRRLLDIPMLVESNEVEHDVKPDIKAVIEPEVEPVVVKEIVVEPDVVDVVVEPEIVVESVEVVVEPEIVVESVTESVTEYTIDHANKPKYECLKCGYRYKLNCPYCKNNI